MAHVFVSWKAREYEYRRKTSDWYWAVWIIVISLAVVSILFNDLLLAILIVLGAFTLSMTANRPPALLEYSVTSEGVRAGKTLYAYDSLMSFWVNQDEGVTPRLLIKSKKLLVPLLVMLIDDVDPDAISTALRAHLPEERITEPLSQKLLEFIGF